MELVHVQVQPSPPLTRLARLFWECNCVEACKSDFAEPPHGGSESRCAAVKRVECGFGKHVPFCCLMQQLHEGGVAWFVNQKNTLYTARDIFIGTNPLLGQVDCREREREQANSCSGSRWGVEGGLSE